MGVGHGRDRSAHGVRARPAPGAVGHSLDAGVTYSVVVGQGGAGPCPFGVRRQQRVGRLSGTSVLPPSQDKTHEPTDSREHLFPLRSCCRSRVSLRVLAEQACLRRSRGHALPHLRRVERQATTSRKDTPELQRCLGALLPAGLHNSPIRPSAVRRPANARVAAVAADHDPPAGNPGYQPPRSLNSYSDFSAGAFWIADGGQGGARSVAARSVAARPLTAGGPHPPVGRLAQVGDGPLGLAEAIDRSGSLV
jgi:hypothetical protein